MKTILSFLAGGALAASALGLVEGAAAAPRAIQDGAQESAFEARVTKLEAALAESVRQNEETAKLLEDTVVYLDRWSQSSNALLDQLLLSEELGFTAGINFQSREVMLAGFRAYWGAQSEGLPRLQLQQVVEEFPPR